MNNELTKENYFSKEMSRKYISCSQIKSFNECESKTLAVLNGDYKEQDKKCFLLGQYMHAWAEGEDELNNFIEKNKTKIFKTQSAKDKKEGIFSKYVEFKTLDNTLKRINDSPKQYEKLLKIIKNENVKHEVIITAKLFGVDFKIMIDCYAPKLGYFADLKLMSEIYTKHWNKGLNKFVNFIKHYQYDMQMIIYSEIEKIASNRNSYLEPIIAVITKEKITDTGLFIGFLDDNLREEILKKLELYIERIVKLKNEEATPISCEKCDWCKLNQSTKVFNFSEFYV